MSWIKTCILNDIVPDTGVCALIAGRQIAIFRVGERAYAIDNIDPFSRAGVLSRGIVGDRRGVLVVASPLYKQAFALDSGECLDEPGRAVATYPTRVTSGVVEVYVDAMVEPRGEPRGQALSVA